MSKKRKESVPENPETDFSLGDIGLPDLDFDLDLSLFDVMNDDLCEETRYVKPKVHPMKASYVCYDNALRLAEDLPMAEGVRYDVFVGGDFIFGDFIEAFITRNNAKCSRLLITTLSLSQDNVDSLANLMQLGYVDQLDLIVSAYFYAHEIHALVPYMHQVLDVDNRFQLAVAGVHTKTTQFETLGGKKILIHGSANLRSSGNIEQFTLEENPELYDFYQEHFDKILERYATIRKPIRPANCGRRSRLMFHLKQKGGNYAEQWKPRRREQPHPQLHPCQTTQTDGPAVQTTDGRSRSVLTVPQAVFSCSPPAVFQ